VVARVLEDLGLSRGGRDVARTRLTQGGIPNVQAVTRLLNAEVNRFLGIGGSSRGTLTADQTEAAYEELDTLGDNVRDRIRNELRRGS
jgi:hypothetical protein